MSGTTVTALRKDRRTPGVYVTEFAAFPPSIVGVATAVPVFVGYTETARDPSSGKQVYRQAIPISSMADYYNYFRFGFDARFVVTEVASQADAQAQLTKAQDAAKAADAAAKADSSDAAKKKAAEEADAAVKAAEAAVAAASDYDFEADFTADGKVTRQRFSVGTGVPNKSVVPQFNLYTAMQLFYANGGGNCFVISVANYWGQQSITRGETVGSVTAQDLIDGLEVARDTRGATMVVVPDACLLTTQVDGVYSDYNKVAVEMLNQAGTLQDRVAILDLPGAMEPASWNKAGLTAQAKAFETGISPAKTYFSYGAAYAPAVESSILTVSDVDYSNLQGSQESTNLMNNLLTTQANQLYPPITPGATSNDNPKYNDVRANIDKAFPPTPTTSTALSSDEMWALDLYLRNAVPLLGQVQQILVGKLNVAPPSGIMAGVWTQNDANRGVWNAPANIALASVIGPKVTLTDEQQGDFNVPLSGNAIDILRALVNRGTVVWGARTLDGNSLDYRYIQVRRTLIYIEQSIKEALQPFVFAANDGNTWVTVTGMISNFLTNLWQSGGLMGDKASDAFTVKCGLGSTMTGLDILNGYMIVNVTVQMIHPAEFIELTFTQTMQGV